MNDSFMLTNKTAVHLYETYAKDTPIYDYHCHLSAEEIYENRPFENIASIWLDHDHYKWRAMRFAGVSEDLITGKADPLDKFNAFAKVSGRLLGSPLYHWANMELSTYFGVTDTLNEDTGTEIYHFCNKTIAQEKLSPVKIITASNVKLICTTDDPVDNLAYHKKLAERALPFQVLPTFRPDKVMKIDQPDYGSYLQTLAEASVKKIDTYETLKEALRNRLDFFKAHGCLLSDHSLESLVVTTQKEEEVALIFQKALQKKPLTSLEAEQFKNHTLMFLAKEYEQRGMVMQLHIGAMRNVNPAMFKELGPDAGFDIMNDFPLAMSLASLLRSCQENHPLPKTVLYTLNDKDNLVLSTLTHCFPQGEIPGKIQFGAPWWFNDHKEGFLKHFTTLGNQGMLADFIGMLTDSRSFLSYARHDYFRRILCDFIGQVVEAGEFENNEKILQSIIEGICYQNIKNYLGVE